MEYIFKHMIRRAVDAGQPRGVTAAKCKTL
jgi:hypothetical protein